MRGPESAARPARLSRHLRAIAAAAAILATFAPLRAAERPDFDIEPGPRVMSDDEKSLAPDPAAGSEHGIILADEQIIDESSGTDTLEKRHFRAKIFTNEARGLADIEVPLGPGTAALKKWWAVAILPDGTVRDLDRADLRREEAVRSGGYAMTALKAVIPGVVPGTVIDFGWHLWNPWLTEVQRIELQRPWPVRHVRVGWIPSPFNLSAYHLSRPRDQPVEFVRGRRGIVVEGRNLAAAIEEPWMPPRQNSFAALTVYYRDSRAETKEFWRLEADRTNRGVAERCRDRALPGLIASMGLPQDANLDGRLRAAYAWIESRIASAGFMTLEEQEEAAEKEPPSRATTWLRAILDEKSASEWDLETLFVCVARALGADAHLALATDRRDRLLDLGLLNRRQFDRPLAVVRAAGAPVESATFVDTGLGLPYGDVAWWVTGANAFLADPKAPQAVKVRVSDAAANLSETTLRMVFDPAQASVSLNWTRTGHGQHGLAERVTLRRADPAEREDWLMASCGSSGQFEIERAVAPGIDAASGPFRMECGGRLIGPDVAPDMSGFTVHIGGPWIEPLPGLPPARRVQPVLFEFARTDANVIEIPAPPGFAPDTGDTILAIPSPYGSYRLTVTPGENGYHVERRLTLTAIGVPAQEYDDLRGFFAEVERADQTSLTFQRTEPAP